MGSDRSKGERDAFMPYGTRNHRERPRPVYGSARQTWVKFGEARCSGELPELRDDEAAGTPHKT
jgi:hypothetical protein